MHDDKIEHYFLQSLIPGIHAHENGLKFMAFKALRDNNYNSKREKSLELQAFKFRLRILFRCWKGSVYERLQLKIDKEVSLDFQRTSLLRQKWNNWTLAQDEIIIYRNNLLEAARYYRFSRLCAVFSKLVTAVNDSKTFSNMLEYANNHFQYRTIKNAFEGWLGRHRLRLDSLQLESKADEFKRLVPLKVSWLDWQRNIIRSRKYQVKYELTVARFEKVHLLKHFDALRKYTAGMKQMRNNFVDFRIDLITRVISDNFRKWTERLSKLSELEVKLKSFQCTRNEAVYAESFNCWKVAALRSKYLNHKLTGTIAITLQAHKREYFVFWSERVNISLYIAKQSKKAYRHFAFGILLDRFLMWRKLQKHKCWVKVNVSTYLA